MPLSRLAFCLTLAAVAAVPRYLCAASDPAPAPAPAAYATSLAEAQNLATEGSWAKARDAYAGALQLAPDADARRWCALWLEDATWRAEGQPGDWQIVQLWQARHQAAFDRLLEPYAKGQPRDDFWAAVKEGRGFFVGRGFRPAAFNDWYDVAVFLGEQPNTSVACDRWISFFQRVLGDHEVQPWERESLARFLPLLSRGSEIGATADQRAWCALTLARLEGGGTKDRAGSWKRALELSEGTRWVPLARAAEFLWRAETGWNPAAVAGSAVDVSALLREATAAREALERAPLEVVSREVVGLLRQFEQRMVAPVLNLQVPARFAPRDAMGFAYGAAGFDRLEIEIYEHTPESWGRCELQPDKNPLEEVARRICSWTIALPSAAELRWKSEVVAFPKTLPPGLYTLAVHGLGGAKKEARYSDFVVSDFGGVLVADNSGGQVLYLFHEPAHEPIAGKRVTGTMVESGGVQSLIGTGDVQSWTGTTDAMGRTELPRAKLSKKKFGDFRVVAIADGHPVPIPFRVWGPGRAGALAADLFLDRPLYRPGETVKWKMIIRERRDGHWSVPDEKLEMKVTLRDEPLVGKAEVTLNHFGTAHGEIAIPAGARPGAAELELKLARDGTQLWPREPFFTVDNFVPPALTAKLALASGAESLRPGREIVVRATATYLSGGPAVGAYIQLKTEINVSNVVLPRPEQSTPFDQWVAKARDEQRESLTDANGAAEFRLRLPEQIPAALQLRLAATVLPEGGQAVHTAAAWQVTSTGRVLDVEGWTTPRLVRLAGPISFACLVRNGAGDPAALTGVAQLVERRWVGLFLNHQGQVVDRLPGGFDSSYQPWNPEPLLPDGWTKLHADYVDTVVADRLVEVASDGRLKVDFTPPRPGLYRLKVMDGGNEITPFLSTPSWGEKPLAIAVADDATHSLPLAPAATAVYAPDRVRSGEPLTALVVLPEGETSAVVTLAGENETISRRVDFKGRASLVTFRQWPHCAGHGSIAVTTLKAGQQAGRTEFSVDQDHGQLRIEAIADAVNPRPGAAAQIALRIHEAKGAATLGEVAVAVSDEAVNGLVARPAQEEIVFARPGEIARPQFGRSPEPSSRKPAVLRDPRQGAVVVFGSSGVGGGGEDGDVVTLSPFVVDAVGAPGAYYAANTLAGSRVRTDLSDASSAISVVTAQFLRDTTAGNSGDLLAYTNNTEVGGITGDFGTKPDKVIEIRRHFASTAAWVPEVVTDGKGEATVEFKYPDNLTQWRIEAYAVGADGNTFGRAATFTRTSLPFQARLQAPRFLVVGDTAQPSALLVNRTDANLTANAELKIAGAVQFAPGGANLGTPAPEADERAQQAAPLQRESIAVPKQGEAHAAWTLKATQPGEANLTLTTRAGAEGDAMELALPVLEDGLQQETAASGVLGSDAQSRTIELPLPDPLDRARTTATVQLSPGHVSTILDALPYLVDYPYGCVEQTMSRFLPAVVVRKVLVDSGLEAAAVEHRILASETKADTVRREKTAGLGRLDEVVQKSMARLNEAQRGDGGFGWWPEAPWTDLWMTAYVAWGLDLARTAGIDVPERLAKQTHAALARSVANGTTFTDTCMWALAVLARAQPSEIDAKAAGAEFQRGYDMRDQLSAAGRACLALAAVKFGNDAQRAVLLRNLENGAQRAGDFGDTVHWGSTGGYWRAMDSAVESTALTLLALLELDPKHPLVEPAASWLALNRRSAHWASTRDTAFAVLALARYVVIRGEDQPDAEIELLVNGQSLRRVKLTRESLLEGPLMLQLDAATLRPGINPIELRRMAGKTPVYAVALASSWAPSDTVKPAGHLIEVARDLVRQKAQPTLAGTLRIVPEPLPADGAATAGEQVTAMVTLTVPNELEYVMVEVPKPAGCEPLNPLSGWDARMRQVESQAEKSAGTNGGAAETPTGVASPSRTSHSNPTNNEGRAVYREERDDQSVFFLDHVEAGTWEIRFGLRATTPGDYRALPVKAAAMYVPEVRANSDACRVRIENREPGQ